MQYMSFQGPNFTMEVPTNWLVSASPQFQAIFVKPGDYSISPNLVISLRPVEVGVTYKAVAESAREAQAQQYPEYEVTAEVDYGAAGGTGMMRHYKWLNADSDELVMQAQAFFVVGQLLFTLTATRGNEPDKAEAIELDNTFKYMIETFRITA